MAPKKKSNDGSNWSAKQWDNKVMQDTLIGNSSKFSGDEKKRYDTNVANDKAMYEKAKTRESKKKIPSQQGSKKTTKTKAPNKKRISTKK